jgi:Na+-transporting NADH:ubiquinone oxidoreductase subunit NqrB
MSDRDHERADPKVHTTHEKPVSIWRDMVINKRAYWMAARCVQSLRSVAQLTVVQCLLGRHALWLGHRSHRWHCESHYLLLYPI